MSLEAELAPICGDVLTQKIVGEFVGALANLDDDALKKLSDDLEMVRAKIVVGTPDRGGVGGIHINRVRVVQALKELVNSLRAIPFRSR
jgi:hypothetical protein